VTTYTYSELETLWLDAAKGTQYATNTWAQLMAAIAMAESGGNSDAYNPSGATGLWQILGAVNASDQGSLTDPTTNAHEALLKLQSQGLGAWTTYTSGAYSQYLQSGVNPSSLPTSSGAGSTGTSGTSDTSSGGLLGFPSDITGFFSDAKTFVDAALWLIKPSSWVRVGAFVFGAFILGAALYVFTQVGSGESLSSPMQKAASAIPKVVPV
jgi:hypothetical protein